MFLLPDTFHLLLVPLLAMCVDRLEQRSTLKNWLTLGLLLGLSALSKYTAIFFVFALITRWLLLRRIRDVLSIKLWLGVATAGLLILPILYWNFNHEWVSFKYQSGHVASWENLDFKTFFGGQLSQFVGLGFLYIYMLLNLLPRKVQWKNRESLVTFSSFERIFIIFICSFIFFSSFFGNFLPHWTAAAFVLGIPWGIANALRNEAFTRPLKWALRVALSLIAFIHIELIFHVLPAAATNGLYQDIQGWPEFIGELSEKAHAANLNLAVTNWTFGSRAMLYSHYRNEVYVLDDRKDQFDFWQKKSFEGKNFLILVEPDKKEQFLKNITCEQLYPGENVELIWHSRSLKPFSTIICLRFHSEQFKTQNF